MGQRLVGQGLPRREGRDKVTGQARYIDDLSFPGMLHGATVRSSCARGRLRGVVFGEGIDWSELTIVTARDIPGRNRVALITDDQPSLVETEIRHAEEPVLLLAPADRYVLEEARRRVTLDVEVLPGVFTIDDALAREPIVSGHDNMLKALRVEKGDVDAASLVNDADCLVVEGTYKTGAQEQLYIEPNGVIAI